MRIWWVGVMLLQVVNCDPQTWSLGNGCSSEVPKDPNFGTNLNATFLQLRANLSEPNKFATADTKFSPDSSVYAMAQCRNYLSPTDCLACFDTAVDTIKSNCSNLGARAVFDGCFLR